MKKNVLSDYQPINCNFYDELELLALRRKNCTILYNTENEEQKEISDIIKDFQIKNKVEYMILESGLEIRLDRLIEVDGKKLVGYC